MNVAPVVDEASSSGLGRLWRLLIDPAPGRLENTTRVVILVLIVVAIGETFRIPEIALSAYVVLFVSRAEAASSAITALIAGVAVIVAIFAALAVLMISLSEPALRIPLIAGVTFIAMFLARTGGELAPALFAAGFIIAYGLTLGDEVLGFALMPGSVANTASFTLPEIAYIPPEEALVQFLLWLALAVAIPVALVIIANLLTGRDPGLLVRAALVDRMDAAAGFCEALPGADRRIGAMVLDGTNELLKLRHLSGLLKRSVQRMPVIEIQRLLLLLLAVRRVSDRETAQVELEPVAQFCRGAARALADGSEDLPVAPQIALTGSAAPLASRIVTTLRAIRGPSEAAPPSPAGPRRLLVADAFTNFEYVQFALKVTLAVMLCYLIQNMLDWPGIHTCMITCFFVSLGTVGDTVQKAALRLSGCIVGAVLGIGTILLLMPLMTDLGELLLAVASVTFLAAWIGFGSERIAYAGWQIGLAFYLSTFQGFGPTLDMETARDRVVGIMLGNVMIFVIFTTIWPVSAAGVARRHLAAAVEHLASLFRAETSLTDHRSGFAESVRSARAVMVNEPLESRAMLDPASQRPIGRTVLAQIQALLVPVLVVLDLRRDGPAAPDVIQYTAALSAWFERTAAWIRDGTGAADIAAGLPRPPDTDEPLHSWLCVLDHDIREIVMPATSPTRPTVAVVPLELSHAGD